ncbi:MAG TPA: sulfite exporter TauE/SafE family protein [Marinobacter sp.]|nr:sulfite exporter TauE/SafE family protein [Marinobacter sp.]
MIEYLALIAIGVVAGFINVLSAGGSMLTLPMLMFMGLPPQMANGTNRVAIVLQSASAVGGFRRMGHGNLKVTLVLAIPAILGSVVGAWLAIGVSDAIFELVLVVAMVVGSVFMLLPQPTLETRPLTVDRLGPVVYLSMFLIGVYGGFIQVGVGVLFLVVLYRILKIDLPQVNVLKVAITLLYMIPALLMFMISDQVRWGLGLVLGAGSVMGAFLAVRVNLGAQGARWVKVLTLVMVAAILVKLLMG